MSWPLRIATLSKGGFSLASFMAAQSDGFWYDFSKTDRLFQENVGPTPADDPGEVIGLALSQRLWGGQTLAQVLAAAPELVTNGDFSGGATGWTNASTGTGTFGVSAGAASIVGTNGSNRGALSQNVGMVVGRTYRLTFNATVTSGAASIGGAAVGAGGVSIASGFNDVYISAPSTSIIAYTNSGGGNVTLDNISIKEVSRYGATQATTSLKPKFQTNRADFDALDDNLLTGYVAGGSSNFVAAKIIVQASISATQIVTGAEAASSADRCSIGLSTGGLIRRGIGSDVRNVGADLRGSTAVIGVTWDGSNVVTFANGVAVDTTAQSGAATTAIPWRLGSLNSNGTAAAFFGGSIMQAVAGRSFLDATTIRRLCNAL